MTKDEAISEIEEYIQDADKAISETEDYIRGWKTALLAAIETIMGINEQGLLEKLVHCKDCKHCKVYLNGYNSYCNAGHNISYADGFCSEGEP